MTETKLLIFDWDGTLMDSIGHIVASMRNACKMLGVEPPSEENIQNIIGLGMKEAIHALFPDQYSDKFSEQFTAAYREFFFTENAPQQLYPGVSTTIQTLYDHGYLLAVATGKSRRGLEKVFNETGIGHLFHTSRCADETCSKPDPLMLQQILSELDIAASSAVMIGDTEYDLQMAQNANMPSIAVTHGVHDVDRLQRFNPITSLDSIPELLQMFSSLKDRALTY